MKSWFHGRWERRVSLMTAGALDEGERRATLDHLAACPRCAAQAESLRRVWAAAGEDSSRSAVMPVSPDALLTRIRARLDQREDRGWLLRPHAALQASAAVLTLGLVAATTLLLLGRPSRPRPTPIVTTPVEVPDEIMVRMERQAARDQVAHFLTEAQDVLVNVASHPHSCDRRHRRLNVRSEARRSRELLSKRAMVVQDTHDAPAAAGVIHDVELTLREVAMLEPCARPWELVAIQKQLEKSRLLLKIDLVTRELVG